MQSLLQYRRILRDVQDDVANLEKPLRTAASSRSVISEGATPQELHVETKAGDAPGVTRAVDPDNTSQSALIVGWKPNDPHSPQNWPLSKKWMSTVTCCLIGIAMTIPTSIEAPGQAAFNADFQVGPLAGSMTTGIFLIGIGVGSLLAGPFSETFGRNAIYFTALIATMLFIMAKALAPTYGAAIAFRFFAAFFASAPMTVAGGTIGDVWKPEQIPFALPFATFCVYSGPILGPVIGAYTPRIGYQWADWISLIILGFTFAFVLLFQPETYAATLLEWRAKHLRTVTGDDRYRTEGASTRSLGPRVIQNLKLPFAMVWTEPIILIFTLYLTLLYFVLFTFLSGYEIIFTKTYGISLEITYILWVALVPGQFIALAMIPYLYSLTKRSAMRSAAEGKPLQPEVALYWAMAGASILMPISLFWMAWTCFPNISIWSPIIASSVFGYALVCIFTTSYQYIIFVYLQYAASALGFMTFIRYVISGALTPAAIVMYDTLGPHWSLTIVAIIATFMAPVPFVLYKYGHRVRVFSKYAVNKA